MNLASDDFELFGIERRFALDPQSLVARRQQLQAEIHPDKFSAQGAAAQRVALQWAMRVNEAYERLKDPVRRGRYLCELEGQSIDAETNTTMPKAFLMQQMELRESLEEAEGAEAVQMLAGELDAQRKASLERLAVLLDTQRDMAIAAQEVRALMFLDRMAADIDIRLEALGQ